MKRKDLPALAANLTAQQWLAALSARGGLSWHKPGKVSFEVNRTCDLRCVQCDFWTRKPLPGTLSLDEWLMTLRTLRRWAGPFALTLGSGEPFLVPELVFPILREAHELGVMTVCVSHGALIDEAMAERVAESGLGSLHLSLDGFLPATHDAGRGVPGTHARVMRAVRLLKGRTRAPVLKVNTIVAGHNLGELEDIVRWASDEGLAGVNFQALNAFGKRWRELWPDPAAAAAAVERVLALKRHGYPVLNAEAQLERFKGYFADPAAGHPDQLCGTYTQFNVLNDGAVKMCTYMDPVGGLRRQAPREIWESGLARERQREIVACKKPCLLLNCNFRPSLAARAVELGRHVLRA